MNHDHGRHIVTRLTVPAITDACDVKWYTHAEVTNKRGLLKRQQCHTFTLDNGKEFRGYIEER